jgi:hypothetical protein
VRERLGLDITEAVILPSCRPVQRPVRFYSLSLFQLPLPDKHARVRRRWRALPLARPAPGVTSPRMAKPRRMPEGFSLEIDKDGWRN